MNLALFGKIRIVPATTIDFLAIDLHHCREFWNFRLDNLAALLGELSTDSR